MATVTVSPKYQVVIPREVREALKLRPGDKVEIFVYEGRLEFIPVRKMKTMRGFVKGMNTDFEREKDRQ